MAKFDKIASLIDGSIKKRLSEQAKQAGLPIADYLATKKIGGQQLYTAQERKDAEAGKFGSKIYKFVGVDKATKTKILAEFKKDPQQAADFIASPSGAKKYKLDFATNTKEAVKKNVATDELVEKLQALDNLETIKNQVAEEAARKGNPKKLVDKYQKASGKFEDAKTQVRLFALSEKINFSDKRLKPYESYFLEQTATYPLWEAADLKDDTQAMVAAYCLTSKKPANSIKTQTITTAAPIGVEAPQPQNIMGKPYTGTNRDISDFLAFLRVFDFKNEYPALFDGRPYAHASAQINYITGTLTYMVAVSDYVAPKKQKPPTKKRK